MKKLILVSTAVLLGTAPSYGAQNCCAGCSHNISQTECTKNCCDPLNGTRETNLGNGVILVKTFRTDVECAITPDEQNIVECHVSEDYICDVNYYGNPNLSDPTCTRCPSGGQTTGTGATTVTQCYVNGGSDHTGIFSYTQACYYSN